MLIVRFSCPTEIKTEEDLVPPGAKPGTIPTDIEHATGLERLELTGKMQGIDIFDMRPLDASRKGTSNFWPRDLCPPDVLPAVDVIDNRFEFLT